MGVRVLFYMVLIGGKFLKNGWDCGDGWGCGGTGGRDGWRIVVWCIGVKEAGWGEIEEGEEDGGCEQHGE